MSPISSTVRMQDQRPEGGRGQEAESPPILP